MNLEQQFSEDFEDEEGFIPLSEFYSKKSSPTLAASSKEEKVILSIMQRKDEKFSAAVYIGQKILETIRWKVGDKVSVDIHPTRHRARILLATEGAKHINTLISSNAKRERMAKFTFNLTEGMNIVRAKTKAHSVEFSIRHAHKFVPFNTQPTGKDYYLVIDVPGAKEEAPEGMEAFEAVAA